MLKIAICDDDKLFSELLSFKIQKIVQENIGIEYQISYFSSIEMLYDQIKADKPDIVFLDIMVNDINSVNWLVKYQHEFGNLSFVIMTAFPTETENLSEVNCCYYLLKSKMTDEQLLRALKRTIHTVAKELSHFETLTFRSKSYTIDYNSVLYIESMKNNLLIHCTDKTTITIYTTLKKIINDLPPHFFQCHKSYIVNMNLIVGYEPHNFIFSDGMKIPIPPKKYKSVISHYQDYINNL